MPDSRPKGADVRAGRLKRDALAIARAGVTGVDPYRAVARAIRRRGPVLEIGPHRFDLPPGAGVHVVALGKAASAMADAALDRLGSGASGIVATARGYPRPRYAIRVVRGSHPIPDGRSLAAGRALLEYVRRLTEEDRVIFLVSGGGSAIAEVPAPGLTLAEIAATTALLLHTDAPIEEITTVRRHLSQIKGGGLARATPTAHQITLALSDVVGDRPEEIASGPTVPDPTRYADALDVLGRHQLLDRVPPTIRRHLKTGERSERKRPAPDRTAAGPYLRVATNRQALEGAAREARARGYRPWILSSGVTGETRDVARIHAAILRSPPPMGGRDPRPWCLLSGGETTVTFSGRSMGRGGRNQEFALAAADVLDGSVGVGLLSIGTDGIDGPTDAAGGWADGGTVRRAGRRGVDLAGALRRHDAYPALRRLGDLIIWGPTGTNVMDLHIGLVRRPQRVTRMEKAT
ncbi:MAG: glycerate kinase type-2 family protein [Thermoplasmata archaeon]